MGPAIDGNGVGRVVVNGEFSHAVGCARQNRKRNYNFLAGSKAFFGAGSEMVIHFFVFESFDLF